MPFHYHAFLWHHLPQQDNFKTSRRISQWVRKRRMLWCDPISWVEGQQLCHSPLLSIKSQCHTHRGVHKDLFHRDMVGDIWQTLAGKYNSEFRCYNQTKKHPHVPHEYQYDSRDHKLWLQRGLQGFRKEWITFSGLKDFQTSSYGAILPIEGKISKYILIA